jgi:hypothetical protein
VDNFVEELGVCASKPRPLRQDFKLLKNSPVSLSNKNNDLE